MKKISSTLFFSLASLVLAADDYYVDANIGNDGYDGTSPVVKVVDGGITVGPKKTIQAAVDLTQENNGDVVYVAEGEYKAGSYGQDRVYGKAGVKIVATGARERTFIVGEADDEGTNGCGSKSKKCVYLPSGAWLKGFTLHGGRGIAFADNTYGGGVWGADVNSSFVVDCVIFLVNQFRNRHESKSAVFQRGKYHRQSFGGVQSVVMTKNNRPVFRTVHNPQGNLLR